MSLQDILNQISDEHIIGENDLSDNFKLKQPKRETDNTNKQRVDDGAEDIFDYVGKQQSGGLLDYIKQHRDDRDVIELIAFLNLHRDDGDSEKVIKRNVDNNKKRTRPHEKEQRSCINCNGCCDGCCAGCCDGCWDGCCCDDC